MIATTSFTAGATRDRLIVLVVLALAAAFLFIDSRPLPILLWDESRNIVNALEMNQAGFGLVTTYEGQPDFWNAKPPLMIWLMTASIRLFGASEWALRLPSMVATIGTLLIVLSFVRRTTGSIATGVLAVAFIMLSPSSFGEHSGRVADYDAVMIFFTTAYLCLFFLALQRRRPGFGLLLLTGAATLCAVMTKDVAGLMPGLGAALFMVATGRTSRLWQTGRYAVVAMAILLVLLAFAITREAQSPGYLAALWHNDVFGRFTQSVIGDEKPRFYYLSLLLAGYFAATPLLLLAPLSLGQVRGRSRFVLLYALSVSGTLLLVLTLAASKLNHYVMPAIPFMAIAAAISLRALIARFSAARAGGLGGRLIAIGLLAIGTMPLVMASAGGVVRRHGMEIRYEGAQAGGYGQLLATLAQRPGPITVVDTGFENDGDPHYTPILRAYRLIWAERGVAIRHVTDPGVVARGVPGVIASCDPAVIPLLSVRGRDIGGTAGCIAVAGR